MSLELPYPDLNFVPLDILTAAEMNQIVANYNYISNQFPVTGENIAEGAVSADKMDWSGMADIDILYENIGTGAPGSSTFNGFEIPFKQNIWDTTGDKTKYHKVVIEIVGETSGTSRNARIRAVNANNETIGTFQAGTECWNNDGAFIRRNGDELVAFKLIAANSFCAKVEIFLPIKVNYTPFLAHSFSGTDVDTGIQNFNGRVNVAPSDISKLVIDTIDGSPIQIQNYYKVRMFGYKKES